MISMGSSSGGTAPGDQVAAGPVEAWLARWRWGALLFLALVVFIGYGNSLHNGFVWDDQQIIVNNPVNRSLTNIVQVFTSPDVLYTDDIAAYYRPLNRLSYLVDYALFGLQPAGYHLVNLLIHLADVLLLYLLGMRLFRERTPAFVAALIFAVHPINTEAVDFFSGRNNLLATLCVLATLLLYLRGRESGRRSQYLLAGVALFCGLLCKEIALMVLPMLFVCHAEPFGDAALPWRERLRSLAPAVAAVPIYVAMRLAVLPALVEPTRQGSGIWARLAQDLYIVPTYLSRICWPAGLQAYYTVPALRGAQWLVPAAIWLALAAGLFVVLRYGDAAERFCLVWIGVNFIPVSNIVPIPSAPLAERYLYLPAVGFWLMAGCLYRRIAASGSRRTAALVAVLLLGVIYGSLTRQRNRDWHDDISFFSALVRVDPASTYGYYNLGGAYRTSGDLARAREEWQRTVELDPHHSLALNQLGNVSFFQGRLAEAEEYYQRAVRENPDNAEAHYNLANLLEQLGRASEALPHYEAFLRRVPPEYGPMVPEVTARVEELRRTGR